MGAYSLILLSGGIGKRMMMDIPKQFLSVGGKPVIVHVLERVDTIEEIEEVIIPSPLEYIEKTLEIIDNYRFSKSIRCIEGGKTRQESVFHGVKAANSENVILHEAVRPFVKREEFIELIQTPEETAIFGIDIPFTVLGGSDYIEETYNRDQLINVQLPQKFPAQKLLTAHEYANVNDLLFTEDASLYFHYYGSKIRVLEGSEYNIKLTKPIDRLIAEIIYKDYILMGE